MSLPQVLERACPLAEIPFLDSPEFQRAAEGEGTGHLKEANGLQYWNFRFLLNFLALHTELFCFTLLSPPCALSLCCCYRTQSECSLGQKGATEIAGPAASDSVCMEVGEPGCMHLGKTLCVCMCMHMCLLVCLVCCCLFVCQFVRLFVLFVCLFVCLCVCLFCLFACLFVCLFVYFFVCLCGCLFVHLFVCLFVCACVRVLLWVCVCVCVYWFESS